MIVEHEKDFNYYNELELLEAYGLLLSELDFEFEIVKDNYWPTPSQPWQTRKEYDILRPKPIMIVNGHFIFIDKDKITCEIYGAGGDVHTGNDIVKYIKIPPSPNHMIVTVRL